MDGRTLVLVKLLSRLKSNRNSSQLGQLNDYYFEDNPTSMKFASAIAIQHFKFTSSVKLWKNLVTFTFDSQNIHSENACVTVLNPRAG